MDEVKQQILFPQIRSYLKLYTTIGLEKISRFNDLDEEQFSAQLVSMKHKLTQVLAARCETHAKPTEVLMMCENTTSFTQVSAHSVGPPKATHTGAFFVSNISSQVFLA